FSRVVARSSRVRSLADTRHSHGNRSRRDGSYKRHTNAARTDDLLVQRVMRAPSHCGFDGETRERAFDDLVAWIERGVRPEGEDVLAPDLSRIGLKWTPILHPEDPLATRRASRR